METIWEADIRMPRYPELEKGIRTDVLIVGGGLAGILCAWEMTRAGIDCVLIEQGRLMQGASGRTTAKATSQHGLIYGTLLERFGPEKARAYWQAQEDGLGAYRELAEVFDFGFEPQRSYVYSTGETGALEAELAACERLRIPARWEKELPLPFPVTGAVCFSNQAQFHPLKLAACLAKELRIFENTRALSFAGQQVRTPKGAITAKKTVIATHFPMLNKHGAYFLKQYQRRSYVIALEGAPKTEGMYLDFAEDGLSVRQAGKWLLLGGGGHRTGRRGLGWDLPEAVAKRYFPQARIVARWATQDCMTLDGMPYIGRYSRSTPGLYVATGFQKWGMTNSMVAAKLLTDLVRGKENVYAPLFSPSRSILHKQLICNGAESVAGLLRLTRPRCPHLGCALRWNKAERSWDCPCHGSRFDEDGGWLDGPANGDMKAP